MSPAGRDSTGAFDAGEGLLAASALFAGASDAGLLDALVSSGVVVEALVIGEVVLASMGREVEDVAST